MQDNSNKYGRRWKGKFNTLEAVYNFPEVETRGLIPADKESNVLGIEACLWTEQIQNRGRLDFMTYPRIVALAEAGWTPVAAKDQEGFLARLHWYLRELDRRHIPYYNFFDSAKTPEPPGPEKKTSGTANG